MGKIAANTLANGDGWNVADVVCTAGPRDRPFEEQHTSISIALVLEGTFQYRSVKGSELMSAGSLLLNDVGYCFECAHEHGTGDRCLSFQYSPDYFERAGIKHAFPIHRIPPLPALSPLVVKARQAVGQPTEVALDELALEFVYAASLSVGNTRPASRHKASDERRISAILRLIESNLAEALPLERLASNAKMSEFHFLRVFKQVTSVTPHQFILRARLREAATQLRTRPDPVLEIALNAGFRDLSNFNHSFRAEFGLSPAQFRAKHYAFPRRLS